MALVGNEKILGSILSVTAIVSVIAVYFLGRKEDLNLPRVLLAGTIITALGGINLGIFYSGAAVITFMAANSIGNSFRWQAIIPLFYNSINRDENSGRNHHYSFVFDVEVMINLGRVAGIAIFLLALAKFPDLAARVVFPLLCLSQFVTYYFGHRIAKTLKTLKPVSVEAGAEAVHEPEPLQTV